MSTYLNNLFNFSRALPAPFNKLTDKTVNVSSVFGDGSKSTLCCTVIKAVNAYCDMIDNGTGGLGYKDTVTVCEYMSKVSDDYHLVAYDPNTGSIIAAVYNTGTELCSQYVLNSKNRDGAACLLAMIPTLASDHEFSEALDIYKNQHAFGFPDFNTALEAMAILCDNAYRRVKAGTINVNVDRSGNLMRITHANIDAGTYEPDSVIAGEFIVLSHETSVTSNSLSSVRYRHEDLVGKYSLSERTLTAEEKQMVPVLEKYYIIPEEIISICEHAKKTTGKPTQMRNFLLRGPAGTGKTEGAKAVAAGLGLPYVSYTCSSETEILDFIGQFAPETDDEGISSMSLSSSYNGPLSYEAISKMLAFPSIEDIRYDPVSAFEELTGIEDESATLTDCVEYMVGKISKKIAELSKAKGSQSDSQKYTYKETDFIKALKYGWVVEVQERATRS